MRITGMRRLGAVIMALCVLCGALCVTGRALSTDAVWPESPGTVVQTNGKLVVDASHAEQGYFMARISEPSSHGFKMRVAYGGGQLMYDLNNVGEYEAFPFQLGSGNYEISLFENVKSNKYSSEGKVNLSVQLVDENAAYIVPNQYVDYELITEAVAKSDEICGTAASPADAYNAVTAFMTGEFAYDFARAKAVTAGQLPDIDYCYSNRMGICQDLSAVMACMLRVQKIPCRLVTGYADKYYHAWTVSLIDGQEVFFDPTAALGCINAKKYTIERMY